VNETSKRTHVFMFWTKRSRATWRNTSISISNWCTASMSNVHLNCYQSAYFIFCYDNL
jgi:hypothetical protein